MDKLTITQVVRYEFRCPNCGYQNFNKVYDFNTCKGCNTIFHDISYEEED